MADDNTSVGKISLVIDLTQDLEKEIGNAAKMVADGLQNQLNKGKFKLNADTSEVKKSIESLPSSMTNAMNSTKSIVQSATQAMKTSIENNVNRTIQSSIAQLSKFSLPSPKGQSDLGSSSGMSAQYTPKVDTSNAIDVDFTEVSSKATAALSQIGSKAEETANKTKESFTAATSTIKDDINETATEAEVKSNSFISSLIARMRNIKMPNFDFSNFSIPKFDFGSFKTPEPVLGTEAQKMQMDLLTRQMDAFSVKADEARSHVRELEMQIAELSKPTGSPIQNQVNSFEIDKLKQELQAAEAEEEKFANKSDAINIKIMNLADKMKAAASATNNNTKAVNGKGNALDSTGKKGSLFGSIFSRLTGTMKTAGETTQRSSSLFDRLGLSFGQVGRMMDRMLLRMVIFNTVIQALTNFSTFMGKALMTNAQFSNSLETVKSNLYTAFMPIYNAILPALNSLMSALATVTSYIASFTSQLFGSTYQASFKSASALQSQIGALDQTDKAAKKTANSLGSVGKSANSTANAIQKAADASKKGLAGFDELNKLGSPKESSGTPAGSGVISPITPTANMAPIESATKGWADKLRNILYGIWAPFKQAWAAEGLNTINAAKYALSGIENLIGSIGKSFYTVWTNGTGTKILDNILKLFQNIFKIIGDIGNIFANAWNKGSIGTQIVQNIANSFNNVLNFLNKVGDSIRKVLSQEGPTFANMFMESLKSASGVIENVTEKLGWIWDHGGQHAFEGLMKLGLKVGELALFIYTNFVVPFANWFVNTISPAIAVVLDICGKVFDKASEFISWLMGTGKPSLEAIVITISSIVGTIKAIETTKAIIKGVTDTFKTFKDGLETAYLKASYFKDGVVKDFNIVKDAVTSFGSKTVEALKTVGSKILDVGKNVADFSAKIGKIAWDGAIDGAKALGEGLKTVGSMALDGAKALGELIVSLAKTAAGFLAAKIQALAHAVALGVQKVATLASTAATKAMEIAQAALNLVMKMNPIGIVIIAITALVAAIIYLWNTNKGFRDAVIAIGNDILKFFKGVGEWFKNLFTVIVPEILNTAFNFIKNIWNNLKVAANTIFNAIVSTIKGAFNGIGAWFSNIFTSAWNGIKGVFSSVGSFFQGIWNTIKNMFTSIGSTIGDAIGGAFKYVVNSIIGFAENTINGFIRAINGAISLINMIPGVNISHLSYLNIPKLATGGVIDQPTLAMVGEAGKEAVMPLENNTGWIDSLAGKIAARIDGVGNSEILEILNKILKALTNQDGDIILNIDGDTFAKIAIKQLNKRRRQTGQLELII